MKTQKINADNIHDSASFHKSFKETLGFPNFYGNNMDAWNDCMTSLDSPEDGMSKITVDKGDILVLEIENAASFKKRCPEIYMDLIECTAFVNYRRMEKGLLPVLTLSFYS
jgi:hypothetical protein